MRLGIVVGVISLGCVSENTTTPLPFIPDVVSQGTGEVFRGTFSPDGDEFYFFRKTGADGEDYRVFRTRHNGRVWGGAELLPLGDSSASTMYPVVSPDGQFLIVTSYRTIDSSVVNANLWMSTRDGSEWADPVPLRSLATLENYDASPWFGPNGRLRFTSTSPDWSTTWYRQSASDETHFDGWVEDPVWPRFAAELHGYHLWSGVIDPTGQIAVAEVSRRAENGALGAADLWIALWEGDDWSSLAPLGSLVNTDGTENFPSFSPDGSLMVFVRDFNSFWSVELVNLHVVVGTE